MGGSVMTVNELVAALQRSSLPTVLVEGPDDAIIFRELERIHAKSNLSILPAGGRPNVLGVYERRNEIRKPVIIFIADQDFWCLSSVPALYNHRNMIFTEGYSIENDLHLDYDFCRLLSAKEKDIFYAEVKKFLTWYALACTRRTSDSAVMIRIHPNTVLENETTFSAYCQLRDSEVYPQLFFEKILSDYAKLLRGKSLLALLIRQLSNSKRIPKHSARGLLEIAAAHRGCRLQRIFDAVGKCLPVATAE